jgi:dUTPase
MSLLIAYPSLTRIIDLASKHMIDTGAGVIDADYRGTVFVLLFNLSDKDFEGKQIRASSCDW